MTLLGHLLAADARRFKVTLAVWLIVVAAESVLNVVTPAIAGQPEATRALTFAATLLWYARLVLFVILIPVIVQTHPLVGSDAFWLTRPIPPRTLLLCKLILLASLLVIAPLVADAVVMSVYRVPPGEMGLAMLQSTLLRLMALMVFMAAAAITPDLSRFAVLCVGALVAMAVIAAAAASFALSEAGDGSYGLVTIAPVPLTRTPDETAGIVAGVLLLVAALVFLDTQYRTRSPRLSIPVGTAAVILTIVVSSVWPWPLINKELMVPGWAHSPSTLRLHADPATMTVEENHAFWSGQPPQWRTVRAHAWFTDVVPSWLAQAQLATATLDLPGGVRLTSRGHWHHASLPVVQSAATAPQQWLLRQVLGVRRVLGTPIPPRGETAAVFLIKEDDRARHQSASGRYQGVFLVHLTQSTIAATLPLERGATFQEGAYRMTIDRIETAARGMTLRARTSQVSTIFDRRPRPRYELYLRNQSQDEAVSSYVRSFHEDMLFPPMRMGFSHVSIPSNQGGFTAGSNVVRFPATYGDAEELPSLDPAWLSGAQLVIVRTVIGGAVPRTVDIADFRIPGGGSVR